MSKRKLTNPDAPPAWHLSQQQQTAVDLVVSGKNLQETADAIGVQRPTVSELTGCEFQVPQNLRRLINV